MGLWWNMKDWWQSRKHALPAPTDVADTINQAARPTMGRGNTALSSRSNVFEQAAKGAENYQTSFKKDT